MGKPHYLCGVCNRIRDAEGKCRCWKNEERIAELEIDLAEYRGHYEALLDRRQEAEERAEMAEEVLSTQRFHVKKVETERDELKQIIANSPDTGESSAHRVTRQLEMMEKMLRFKAERDSICPCNHTTPCHPDCACASPESSRGCERCCAYGSKEQQKSRAESIAQVWAGRDAAYAVVPDTFYAALAPLERLEMLVDHWRRGVVCLQELQAERDAEAEVKRAISRVLVVTEAKRDAALKALQRYGRHYTHCPRRKASLNECGCGWGKVYKELLGDD